MSERHTSSGKPATNPDDAPVPDSAKRPDGQHVDHWVMSPEERARGFVRPVRLEYRHVGKPRPVHPLRDLTDEEHARYRDVGYVKFETYPQDGTTSVVGRFWTEKELRGGCNTKTSMPQSIAETYAANPRYYGSTFCCGCGEYLPVGVSGEFVWEGTDERVGT